MSAAVIKSRLLAIRADFDAKIDEAIALVENDPEAREPSPWMTMAQYAEHAGVSTKTVRRWIDAGLPHAKAPIRIHREQGDAWRTK